jgi:hypothetical protein
MKISVRMAIFFMVNYSVQKMFLTNPWINK